MADANARAKPLRRPRGEMRELILDTALELFNEQGYDKTSLRQIAERIGVTKAALYYHFERKDDLLLELHLRLHDLGRGILDQLDELEDERDSFTIWPSLLDRFIDQVLANTELFLLHQRNSRAFEQMDHTNERHQAENDDLEQRFRRFLANPAIPLEQRVRMACSVGAVFGALMGMSGMFGDGVSTDTLAPIVRKAARDMLTVTPGAANGASR
jgi:AcrR family transcriptional regulator